MGKRTATEARALWAALGVVTLAALAKSFTDARREGNYTEFVEGLAKGGVVTGVVIASASLVGGPVYVGLLAGICTGVVANKVMNRVDGAAIRDFVVAHLDWRDETDLRATYRGALLPSPVL